MVTIFFSDQEEESLSIVSLSKVVPLRKQLGFLNMFSQLIDVLGAQASQYLPRLLAILFYCLGICKDSLEQRDKVRYRDNPFDMNNDNELSGKTL